MMKIDYQYWDSPALDQKMELKIFGQGGLPFIVFPTSSGRFYDFENQGMVESVRWFIERNELQLFCVDSIDGQSWDRKDAPPAVRAQRHQDYVNYIVQEVVPFVHGRCEKNISGRQGTRRPRQIYTTGCSMGATHAANLFFAYPQLFKGCVCLSGVYQPQDFFGDFINPTLKQNSPLLFLPEVTQDKIRLYQQSDIIVCCGQGNWEDLSRRDQHLLWHTLHRLKVPAWLDWWGYDVCHDWPWWRKQLPYFVGHILAGTVRHNTTDN